ncbi:Transcriptional regulator, AcrR family [hydrothermal vent metagenome]|uniref:Transcriptional regulator, AcrR family n=1 Tax=hydrothermal vent metagenome TaxID=652676 RepID=A0A3B0XT47_9ZZZZ
MSKRLSAEERRASIIKVAKSLFAKNGVHGVSIDEIVKEVGVSPAILYRHFESKDELYESVLQEFSATRESYVETVVADDNGFEQVLRGMTTVFVSSIINHPDMLKMEMHSQLEDSKASQEFFLNRWKSFTDYIEFNLNELQSQNKIKPINAKVAALIYQGIIREVLLQKCMQHTDRFEKTPVAILVDDVITLFMKIIEPANT